MMHDKTMRMTSGALAALFVLAAAAPASAGSSTVGQFLLPGLGQAQNGHYTKATLFASAAMISGIGLFATQVNYARSTERYENEKRTYLYYQDQIDNGELVQLEAIEGTHQAMEDAYSDADNDEQWRNAFLGALIATYALNIVDLLLSDPDTGEVEPATSLEVQRDGFRLVRTFRF